MIAKLPTLLPLLAFGLNVPALAADDPVEQCLPIPTLRNGSALDDQILDALRDADGNLYLAGFERGQWGVENDWPVGNVVGVLEKRSAEGELLWRRTIDSAGIDIIEAITLLRGGGVAVTGRSSGVDGNPHLAGPLDAFVATLDGDGQPTGMVQFGDERPQHPTDLIELDSGELVVSGYDDIFVQGGAVIDWENGFLARIGRSDEGELELHSWLRSQHPASDRMYSVVDSGDGTGDVLVAVQLAVSPQLFGGTHLQRIGTNGGVRWSRRVSRHPADAMTRLVRSEDGKVYAAGAFLSALGGPSQGNSEAVLMRIDPRRGKRLWTRRIGHTDPEWVTSLAVAANGEIHMAGSAYPSEDAGSLRDRTFAFGAVYSSRGERIDRWSTPPSDDYRFAQSVSVIPGRCASDTLIAGAVTGALPDHPALGWLDSLLVQPDTLNLAD